MANKGIRANTTGTSQKGADVTGTPITGEKFALDVVIANAIAGSFSPSGLKNGGLHQEITINETTWTQLPAAALTARNQINIQNFSGSEIKINLDNGVGGYIGMRIPNNTERFYQITDAIALYAKSEPGSGSSVVIDIEEIS